MLKKPGLASERRLTWHSALSHGRGDGSGSGKKEDDIGLRPCAVTKERRRALTRSSKVCFSTVRCPVAMPCRWAHHLRVVVVNGWEGGGLVNKNRSMSIGLEEDASGRGFDLGLMKSSLFHFSLTRGLFLFLDQRPAPTLSHQSPSPMVPTDQTPDTTNKLSLTCGPATPPTLFRGNGPPPTNHSRNSACRGWRKRESTPPEPVRRRQPGGSQPHHRSHQHQWRSSCSRRGSRKDVISPCPVRPARPLACERREPKRPTYQVLKLSSTCLRSLSRSLTP